ncbi:hypothetical protein M0R45_013681 [Rubus argutus]|uniref:Galectin n=1 Tax=Rubus argutus TaxID=59490 RepID=A0AAW1XJV6_RUBAR
MEGRLFILTIRAGVDGFHISVGGRHVTSFPYRTGFTLEDATGLAIKGDVDVHSVYVTSLPSFSSKFLTSKGTGVSAWQVRKTWMQSSAIKSSQVVVRFFVALNARKEVNAVLKKEAAYFGDIVILPLWIVTSLLFSRPFLFVSLGFRM